MTNAQKLTRKQKEVAGRKSFFSRSAGIAVGAKDVVRGRGGERPDYLFFAA